MIEVDRTGASAKCDARRSERAGCSHRIAAPAPMLSVPIAPAFVAITIGPVTMPPFAIVCVPRPKLPMFTPELLLQVEPAPATVTVPCEPALLPMLAAKAVLLMTIPPLAIVSVPVPKLPTLSPPPGLLFQVEPGPITITVPVEPTANPTEPPPPLFTVPPFWMVSVPLPKPPTTMVPVFVHVEPAPDTIAVPREPGKSPTNPPKSVNVPPFWTRSIPIPFSPTARFRALAPAPVTAVKFGVTVSMFALALVAAVKGTPALQLPALNQSEDTAPVQLVCARADTVDAASSASVIIVRKLRATRIASPG